MKQNLIVADTAFINNEILKKYELISVFPMKKDDGAHRSSLDDLTLRSKFQASFFDIILPKLTKVFCIHLKNVKTNEFECLLRPILVRITSIFIDHYLRIIFRLRQLEGKSASVLEVEDILNVKSHSFFDQINSSWHFNQVVIMRIMLGLGYKSKKINELRNYPEFPNFYPVPNYLFAPYGNWRLNIIRRIWTIIGFISQSFGRLANRKAKYVSAGFSSDEYYIKKRGMYGPFGKLVRLKDTTSKIITSEKNNELRDRLKFQIIPLAKEFLPSLIEKIDPTISNNKLDLMITVWVNMIIDWFPTYAFENLEVNLLPYKKIFNNNNITSLIGENGSLLNNEVGFLRSVAAKKAGKKIVGLQHSAGHYGYIDDFSYAGQFEYSHLDTMLTFGWIDIETYFPNTNFVKIPCPKLSEKPLKYDYTNPKEIFKKNKKDILFLSNTFHRFPMGGTSGQSRVDFIDEITQSQIELMKALNNAKISIDHKPYNKRFIDLYSDHFYKLMKAGGNIYKLLESKHKGLTINFIKTARIILWDQIGSGTVECFTSGIPTIIFWKRIYSREAKWSRKYIADLESCGIIHSDPETLITELKIYLLNPRKWMNEKLRITAIKKFCHRYSRIDADWPKIWKSKLL